jgi:hypothetical protein|nr:MAG TPA: structural protein [Caudoviricetes sp.]
MITERNKRIKKAILYHRVDIGECSLLLGYNRKEFNVVLNERKLNLGKIIAVANFVGLSTSEIIDLFF